MHNEDPKLFRALLESILAQSRRVDEIWVIDDGSESIDWFQVAKNRLAEHPNAHVIRYELNHGKRQAQAEAFRKSKADIFLTCDSDTVLDYKAVEEGLKPFSNPTIKAVTSNVRALNRDDNLLTRLIDHRYQNAFQRERTAYSVFGSVLCATGIMSFYRGDIVRENLNQYLDQYFLGVKVMSGDDKRLTNYCQQKGKVVIQQAAKARTAVPRKLSGFLRQQVRWNQSFFRESLFVLTNLTPKHIAWWLTLSEMGLWLVFGLAVLLALIISPLTGGKLLSVYYLAFIFLTACQHNPRR